MCRLLPGAGGLAAATRVAIKSTPRKVFGSTRHITVAVLSEAHVDKRASQRLEDARSSTECRAADYFVSEDVLHALVALIDFARDSNF